MKTIKQFLGGIILCLCEVAIGILLLVNPVGFTAGIITAFGIVLGLWGIGSIIGYFRQDAEEAAASQSLMKGLVLLLAGGFCVLKKAWIIAAFPVMTLVYGVVILISGMGKVQWTADMLRAKNKKWFFAAISAVVSIICAVVILRSPFTSTAALWIFTGVSLICEAILDMVTFLISGRKNKADEEITEIEGEEVAEA